MPTLKLLPNRYKRPLVLLHINKKQYKFLIDTGATHTILSECLLSILTPKQLQNKIRSYSTGVGGRVQSDRFPVQFNFVEISIYSVIFSDEVVQPNRIEADGIIGQDILQQYKRVIIDNEKQLITFEL